MAADSPDQREMETDSSAPWAVLDRLGHALVRCADATARIEARLGESGPLAAEARQVLAAMDRLLDSLDG
ncbi:hypothetical protein [Thermaurantiacus sp.]